MQPPLGGMFKKIFSGLAAPTKPSQPSPAPPSGSSRPHSIMPTAASNLFSNSNPGYQVNQRPVSVWIGASPTVSPLLARHSPSPETTPSIGDFKRSSGSSFASDDPFSTGHSLNRDPFADKDPFENYELPKSQDSALPPASFDMVVAFTDKRASADLGYSNTLPSWQNSSSHKSAEPQYAAPTTSVTNFTKSLPNLPTVHHSETIPALQATDQQESAARAVIVVSRRRKVRSTCIDTTKSEFRRKVVSAPPGSLHALQIEIPLKARRASFHEKSNSILRVHRRSSSAPSVLPSGILIKKNLQVPEPEPVPVPVPVEAEAEAEAPKPNSDSNDSFRIREKTRNIVPAPYPILPPSLTIDSLLRYLSGLNVKVENKRPLGGSMWAYYSKLEFDSLAEHLKKGGVDVRFYPVGRKTHPGQQWELDTGKRLK